MADKGYRNDKKYLEDNYDPFETGMVRPTRVFDMNIVSPVEIPPIGKSANGADERTPESVNAYGPIDGPMSSNPPAADSNKGPTTHGGSGGMADQGLGF